MILLYRSHTCGLALVLLLLIPMLSSAQNSVWGGSATAPKTTGQKAATTTNKLKDFKNHLQKWGLDTNYKHAFLIGGKLNSDGWSGCMNFVKKRSYKISTLWQISFSEIKHEKQTKLQGTDGTFTMLGNPSSYVFGKINNLYTLQIGFGKEKLLLPAVLEGNLSVSFRYSGGLSTAMLKPYYLKLIYQDYGGATAHIEQHSYSKADSAVFLNTNTILGASTWSKGLDEIDYVPGAYIETAIAITPGKNKSFIQVIILGANASYYANTLPIMVDQTAHPWQVSLFAGLMIGKRWK